MKVLRRVFFLFLILGISSWWSAAQERDTTHSRNYQNCLYGRFGCDPAQLTADEEQAVARSAHDRNYQNCLYGRFGCDPGQLTANEQSAVARSAHDRNYQNCLYGRYGCDPTQLSANEHEAVTLSAHDRNYQNCVYGRYGCDSSQLTADEQQRVASSVAESSTSAGSGTTPRGTSSSTGPACAENGSCYGDISERTGRPKTVHVQGYYRKDGTYVRGHYRSAPRHR